MEHRRDIEGAEHYYTVKEFRGLRGCLGIPCMGSEGIQVCRTKRALYMF